MMTRTGKFWPRAFAEYVVGLYASGLMKRVAAPPVAIALTMAFLVGLCDAITGWRMEIPLWARIVSAFTFAVFVAILIEGHIRRTRAVGRRALNERAKA